MKRRIFIGIDLPAELKAETANAITQWRFLPIRWTPPENWHVTLVPPCYLEDQELSALVKLLERRKIGEPFPVAFSRVLLAPPGAPARMIWLEGATPPELPKLKNRLEKLWASQPSLPASPKGGPSLKPESRLPHLHVTLARFEPGHLRELEAKTRVLGEVNFSFTASEIAVMESRLKPSGAEYGTLATIPLSS